jgi:CubicO group peptidase (beta-lactamase class C family)
MRFELAAEPGSTYHYANINWLLLGLVIEHISGRPYESYCYDTILKPLNLPISGLSTDWLMMSSYGGWHISAQDYAKFASQLARSVKDRDGPVNRWLIQLSNESGGAGKSFYALGTFMRFTPVGRTLWHTGSWNVKTSGVDGFMDVSFGAYFASFDNGYTYVTNYSKGIQGKALGDLDRAMWSAIKSSAN